jgi:hypothetical protein
MDESENNAAVVEEFVDSDEEIQRQIVAEWDRMYEAGDVIREGDAARSVALDWFAKWGTILERIIYRPKG